MATYGLVHERFEAVHRSLKTRLVPPPKLLFLDCMSLPI
jgi:hypothetical protein